ncbi:hypothetical protein TNCV_5129381 [Trichonephila clavipes]|nr:hypothetical protein TNCV_5129381 [Trichonephila clavipes]
MIDRNIGQYEAEVVEYNTRSHPYTSQQSQYLLQRHSDMGGHPNAQDEVLEPNVCLFMSTPGNDFILMEDNARPHGARPVDEFLEIKNIHRMD